jgi:hypothetical protein
MLLPVKYRDAKKKVRSELTRLALVGELTYYGELGEAVGKHKQWPHWGLVLNGISEEENRKELPDITFLVLNSGTGWPSQIDFKRTDGEPSEEQRQRAQLELNKIFRHYCPDKPAPILPRRRSR